MGDSAPGILVLRDPRESIKRCSLTPLRGLEGISFVEYSTNRRVDGSGRVLLHPDGEVLSAADEGADLLLVDCSWRRLPTLLAAVDGDPPRRRAGGGGGCGNTCG